MTTVRSIFPTEIGNLQFPTTAWLPISTPWPSVAECSAQIYVQAAPNGDFGRLIAFDPLYGTEIVTTAIQCLPPQFTSFWFQSNPATTTLLGPTFVCPGAYTAVETVQVNAQTEQVLCCPSQYTFNRPVTKDADTGNNFPSQCYSHLTSGQTLPYESTTPYNDGWGIETTVVSAAHPYTTVPTIVWGMHVNGYNVLPQTATSTAPPTVATTTSTNGGGSSSSSIVSSSSNPVIPTAASNGTTTGPTGVKSSSTSASSQASPTNAQTNDAVRGFGVAGTLTSMAVVVGLFLICQ